jgi:hypothetical protein
MPQVVSTPVAVVRERLMCDCGGEIIRTDGGVRLSNPAQYPHECNKCGQHQYIRGGSYPRIRYDETL